MRTKTLELSGWNRFPRLSCQVARPERYRALQPVAGRSEIARGMGRSYGDAALNEAGQVTLVTRLNRMLDFDPQRGVLECEAGVTLAELIDTFLPRGWFPAITPGTRFVTLGGCIASDVHGKNHHHAGSFAACVEGFELITADGEAHWCGPQTQAELFHATLGGMGLTGHIGRVRLRLKRVESGWMRSEHHPAEDLEDLMALMAEDESEYTVAWIDCLSGGARRGRGIFMSGRHLAEDELTPEQRRNPYTPPTPKPRRMPFDLPGFVLNRWTVAAFNELYYRRQAARGSFSSGWQGFFYPLDAIADWNRLYGRRGFIQYQCVLPLEEADAGIERLLDRIRQRGKASFLAVLKRMGPANEAPLSFPMEGYTLAVDLPLHGSEAERMVTDLNDITLEHAGRIYLAKDAVSRGDQVRAMYPRLEEWLALKARIDPQWHFRSRLSQRLGWHHD